MRRAGSGWSPPSVAGSARAQMRLVVAVVCPTMGPNPGRQSADMSYRRATAAKRPARGCRGSLGLPGRALAPSARRHPLARVGPVPQGAAYAARGRVEQTAPSLGRSSRPARPCRPGRQHDPLHGVRPAGLGRKREHQRLPAVAVRDLRHVEPAVEQCAAVFGLARDLPLARPVRQRRPGTRLQRTPGSGTAGRPGPRHPTVAESGSPALKSGDSCSSSVDEAVYVSGSPSGSVKLFATSTVDTPRLASASVRISASVPRAHD